MQRNGRGHTLIDIVVESEEKPDLIYLQRSAKCMISPVSISSKIFGRILVCLNMNGGVCSFLFYLFFYHF